MKKVTVIMSTYNTPNEYLEKATNSILNQTYKNIEFIIVVDGDKDNLLFLKKFKDDRIKIIYNEKNIGLPASLNKAIKISTGEYIARMDSDDISLPNRIEMQLNYLEKYKYIDILGTYALTFGDRLHISMYPYYDSESIKAQLMFRCALIHPTIMIRKSFLIKNKLDYNEQFYTAQDYELWCRALVYGNITIAPFIGLKLRIHKKQASQEKRQLQIKNSGKIISKNISNILKDKYLINYESIEHVFMILGQKEKLTKDNYVDVVNIINFINRSNIEVVNKKKLQKEMKILMFISIMRSKLISFKVIKHIFSLTIFEYIIKKIFITTKCYIQYKIWEKKYE